MYTTPGSMVKETQQLRFVVKVNGITMTSPQPSRQLAEAAMAALTPEQRQMATIVPVTGEGKELLFETF